jgi:hypothetical protein
MAQAKKSFHAAGKTPWPAFLPTLRAGIILRRRGWIKRRFPDSVHLASYWIVFKDFWEDEVGDWDTE